MADPAIMEKLRTGLVVPAHPLALTEDRRLDERRQRALTRYYLDAGAGGLAVGVHTTQFAIHRAQVGLYRPVLELAGETAGSYVASGRCPRPFMIAGMVGDTQQACAEAELARQLDYDLGLLSLTALRGQSVDVMLDHVAEVGRIMPIMGFYLQQSISGMTLPGEFWRRLFEIPAVVAVKIAPFNRYQTLDVLEAVARSGRAADIAVYAGNDDNIIVDLLTEYEFQVDGETISVRIVGGLLGQWACWTRRAVEQLEQVHSVHQRGEPAPMSLLTLASAMTLANKAIFDADHAFAGCIPGISHVLMRQGLFGNTLTLDAAEALSPGQCERIDGVIADYPHLTDDEFVRMHLDEWLS